MSPDCYIFLAMMLFFIGLSVANGFAHCDCIRGAGITFLLIISNLIFSIVLSSYAKDYFKEHATYTKIEAPIVQKCNAVGEVKQSFDIDVVIDGKLIEKHITLDKNYDIDHYKAIYYIQNNSVSYLWLFQSDQCYFEVVKK